MKFFFHLATLQFEGMNEFMNTLKCQSFLYLMINSRHISIPGIAFLHSLHSRIQTFSEIWLWICINFKTTMGDTSPFEQTLWIMLHCCINECDVTMYINYNLFLLFLLNDFCYFLPSVSSTLAKGKIIFINI